jgi:hypothetical protein
MFSPSSNVDLTTLLNLSGASRTTGSASLVPGLGGNDKAGMFQLLLAQVLIKLLERLETQTSPAAGPWSGYAGPDLLPPATGAPPAHSAARGAYGVSATTAPGALGVLPISAFPRPAGDNGVGIHWIPTVAQPPEAVDRFVAEAKAMNVKWVTILNDGTNIGQNDYLVRQLTATGIEPVMRIYTDRVAPIEGDLGATVRHYTALGVDYFQLFNEPNHVVENAGQHPDVERYLDAWLPAARVVVANGGLPGFGALGPAGEFSDTKFLTQALRGIRARGETATLDRAWLSLHNYQADLPLDDPGGFSRFTVYADIFQRELGRVPPMIGTEGGGFVRSTEHEAQRTPAVIAAYKRLMQGETPDYLFAYSYWVIANKSGGGHDDAWEWQALFQDGYQSPLVQAMKDMG